MNLLIGKILVWIKENSLLLFVLVPLLTTSFVYLQISLNNLKYPYSILAGLEDENLVRSIMALKGQSLYPPLINFPYVVTLYPPLYYYIASLFVKIIGPNLFAGRLLSFLCSLITAFLCFLIVRFKTKSFLSGLIALLFFLTSGFLQRNGQLFKNDIMAAMFSLLGIYVFIRFDEKKRKLFSIPFFLMAFFTKQTALVGLLAVCLYLFLNSQFSYFKKYSLTLFTILAAVLILLVALTKGQFAIDTVLVPGSINWDLMNFLTYWTGALRSYGYLLFPAIGYVVYEKIRDKKLSVVSWFFIFSVIGRYDLGIIGSGDYYFMETAAISGVLTALLISEVRKKLSWSFLIIIAILGIMDFGKIGFFAKIGTSVLFFILTLLAIYSSRVHKEFKNLKDKLQVNFLETAILFLLLLLLLYKDYPQNLKTNFALVLTVLFIVETFLRKIRWNLENISLVSKKVFLIVFLLIIWQKFTGMSFPFISPPPFPFPVEPPTNLAPYQEKLDAMIKRNPGRVLIDSESYLAIKNNRDFEYVPVGLSLRNKLGYWNFKNTSLYKDIEAQKFRFFITSQGWTDQEILDKIYEHYRLTKIVNANAFFYQIFEPDNKEYRDTIIKLWEKMDGIIKEQSFSYILSKKIDDHNYLTVFSFADGIYGNAFLNIVDHPDFKYLYKSPSTRNFYTAVIFKCKDDSKLKEIISEILPPPKFNIINL